MSPTAAFRTLTVLAHSGDVDVLVQHRDGDLARIRIEASSPHVDEAEHALDRYAEALDALGVEYRRLQVSGWQRAAQLEVAPIGA